MITMRQLEVLCVVIDSGSITRASERLFLSQPAVSKIIASLENQTRLKLFRREHRRIVPTAEASHLYEGAQRLLVGITDIARLAEELRSLNSGSLSLACLASLGQEAVPALLARFLAARPQVDFTFQIRSSNKIMQWAIAQQIDLGIAMTAMEHDAVVMERLCAVDAVCVLPPGHRLASRSEIVADDLDGERFVSFGDEGRMRQVIDQTFASFGVKRHHAATTFNSHSACCLVMQGLGASVVDPFAAQCFAAQGMIIRPFKPGIEYNFQLLWPRFKEPSELVKALVPLLRSSIRHNTPVFLTGDLDLVE